MRRETRGVLVVAMLLVLLSSLAMGCPRPDRPLSEGEAELSEATSRAPDVSEPRDRSDETERSDRRPVAAPPQPQPPSSQPPRADETDPQQLASGLPPAPDPVPGAAAADTAVAEASQASQEQETAHAPQSDPQQGSQASRGEPPAAPDRETPGNRPLFDGWGEPAFALLLTGRQHGYIEPCGCTGLENQKGGLIRRHSLAERLRERGWTVVPMDVGNQVRRFGRQAEIKFQVTVEGLRKIGYQAVTFGPDDLKLSLGDLVAATTDAGDQKSPFISANASILDLTPGTRVLQVDGRKIGVAAVMGDARLKEVAGDEIARQTAAEGLAEAWQTLEPENCDLHVLLAHATLEETRQLVRQFPQFQVAVTAGGAGEPRLIPEVVEGTGTQLIEVGTKGMYAGVVGYFPGQMPQLRYQRIPLDARFPDTKPMMDLLAAYQQQLKQAGLEGLGLRPIPHPTGDSFVGSQKCGECHDSEYEVWAESGHAHATESIVHPPNDRGHVARHYDPECLSCHVTGWNPQKYFPYTSGYLKLSPDDHFLHGSGCENCHGPGSRHVQAEEEGAEAAVVEQLREQMRLPLAMAERTCVECHDLDNSPDFDFDSYWESIAH